LDDGNDADNSQQGGAKNNAAPNEWTRLMLLDVVAGLEELKKSIPKTFAPLSEQLEKVDQQLQQQSAEMVAHWSTDDYLQQLDMSNLEVNDGSGSKKWNEYFNQTQGVSLIALKSFEQYPLPDIKKEFSDYFAQLDDENIFLSAIGQLRTNAEERWTEFHLHGYIHNSTKWSREMDICSINDPTVRYETLFAQGQLWRRTGRGRHGGEYSNPKDAPFSFFVRN